MGMLSDFFVASPNELHTVLPGWLPVADHPITREADNPFTREKQVFIEWSPAVDPPQNVSRESRLPDFQHVSHLSCTRVDHAMIENLHANITSQSNSSEEPRHTFTGQEWDADTELFYYRARWYDAAVGRFISEDPIGFAGGDANVSRYVGNDPVNFTDASGLRASPNGSS